MFFLEGKSMAKTKLSCSDFIVRAIRKTRTKRRKSRTSKIYVPAGKALRFIFLLARERYDGQEICQSFNALIKDRTILLVADIREVAEGSNGKWRPREVREIPPDAPLGERVWRLNILEEESVGLVKKHFRELRLYIRKDGLPREIRKTVLRAERIVESS